MVKSMVKTMLTRVFRFYMSFFSGKKFYAMGSLCGLSYLKCVFDYTLSSVESQNGVNAVQRCSIENQKGATAVLKP